MSQTIFDQRVTRIDRKHRTLAGGASYRVGPDGLIVAVPQRRFLSRVPSRGLMLLVGGVFAFKAALLVASGEGTYNARLADLAQGRPVEQAMAWLMWPDPLSRGLAAGVGLAYHMTGANRP